MLRKFAAGMIAWVFGAAFILGSLASLTIQLAGLFGHPISL